MATIPDEILTIIFSSLPVKSLLRFKCLSKSTCSLIDHAEFAKLHLDLSVSNESDLCLAIDDMKRGSTMHYIDLDLDDNYLPELHRELKFDYEIRERKLLGTCNGMIALYEGSARGDFQGMILRNPSTNMQQLVGNFWGDEFLDPYHEDVILDGFGYDAANDDYKLVRAKQCRSDKTTKARVYSSRTGVSRTLPDCPYVYAPVVGNPHGVYVAGNLHWIVWTGNIDPPSDFDSDEDFEEEDEEEELIIGFNLTTETFHVVPHPAPQNFFTTLGTLRGRLAICSYNSTTQDLEIWLMRKYNSVATSWTKLVSITLVEQEQVFRDPRPKTRVLYLTRKEDRVLLEVSRTYLYWYNIVLRRIEYFQVFANVPSTTFYSQLMSRSLVSLPEAQS